MKSEGNRLAANAFDSIQNINAADKLPAEQEADSDLAYFFVQVCH
jgi:hypothetical protein